MTYLTRLILCPVQRFLVLPTAADWKRFDTYAVRVRKLVMESNEDVRPSSTLFDAMARTRTRFKILPNLESLQYSDLEASIPFMHDAVASLSVDFTNLPTKFPMKAHLVDITHRMPNLTSFALQSGEPLDFVESEIVTLLMASQFIKCVRLPARFLSTQIFRALSIAQFLKVFDFSSGFKHDLPSFNSELAEDNFPALETLSLVCVFEEAFRFLSSQSRPRLLTCLTVESPNHELPKDFYHACSIIAQNYPRMTSLSLASLRSDDPFFGSDDDDDDQAARITLADIRPAFRLSKLAVFNFTHHYPLALCQSDVEDFASQFPQLKRLCLNADPMIVESSPLTLEALIPFARHCPKIEHLGLFVDATKRVGIFESFGEDEPKSDALPFIDTIPTFKSLELNLANSIIDVEGDRRCDLPGTYLGQVLDEHCVLKSESSVWEDLYKSEVVRQSIWKEVAKVLPSFIWLRKRERKKVQAMQARIESRLEDLKRELMQKGQPRYNPYQ